MLSALWQGLHAQQWDHRFPDHAAPLPQVSSERRFQPSSVLIAQRLRVAEVIRRIRADLGASDAEEWATRIDGIPLPRR
jgi:hypothetical protein